MESILAKKISHISIQSKRHSKHLGFWQYLKALISLCLLSAWEPVYCLPIQAYRWTDKSVLSAPFVISSVDHYILREFTTMVFIKAFLSRWCQTATGHCCPNKKHCGPNNRLLKSASRSILADSHWGMMWLTLQKECQCLAVKPVCVWGGGASVFLPPQREDHLKCISKTLKPFPFKTVTLSFTNLQKERKEQKTVSFILCIALIHYIETKLQNWSLSLHFFYPLLSVMIEWCYLKLLRIAS